MLRVEPSEDSSEDYQRMCRAYRAHGEADYSSIGSIEDALARLERERRGTRVAGFPGLVVIVMFLFIGILATACSGASVGLAFFRGKTVTIIVPHGPGGMNDYARAIAPYLQKYLPGSRVGVRNVVGEGGIVGKNQIFSSSPDGLTLGFSTTAGSLFAEWALQPSVRYRTEEFSYLGRVDAEAHVLVLSAATSLRSLDDVRRAGRLSMGFAGLGGDDYYVALMTAGLLGFKVDVHTEFKNMDEACYACVRGGVEAVLLSASTLQPQIEAGTVIPIAVFQEERLGSLPLVPSIFEKAPAAARPVLKSIVEIYGLDRSFFAPPGLPEGRLAALRGALDRAMADPEFLENMRRLGRPIDYLPGAATTALLGDILSDRERIRQLVLEVERGRK